MKKKKCLISSDMPITIFQVPIIGASELLLTEDEIHKCLCSKASVKEILQNGEMIELDFSNYNKENFKPETKVRHIEEEVKEPVITDEIVEEHKSEAELVDTEEVSESFARQQEVNSRNSNYNKKNKNKK